MAEGDMKGLPAQLARRDEEVWPNDFRPHYRLWPARTPSARDWRQLGPVEVRRLAMGLGASGRDVSAEARGAHSLALATVLDAALMLAANQRPA